MDRDFSSLKRTIDEGQYTRFAERNYSEVFKLYEMNSTLDNILKDFSKAQNDSSVNSNFYALVCRAYRLFCKRNNIEYDNMIDHELLNEYMIGRFAKFGSPLDEFGIDIQNADFCNSQFRLSILYNFQIYGKTKKNSKIHIYNVQKSVSEKFWNVFREVLELKDGYEEITPLLDKLIAQFKSDIRLHPYHYFIRAIDSIDNNPFCNNKVKSGDSSELSKSLDQYKCMWVKLILNSIADDKIKKNELGTQLLEMKSIISEFIPELKSDDTWTQNDISSYISDESLLKVFADNDRRINKQAIELRQATRADKEGKNSNSIWSLFIKLFEKYVVTDKKGEIIAPDFKYIELVKEILWLLQSSGTDVYRESFCSKIISESSDEPAKTSYIKMFRKREEKKNDGKSRKFSDVNYPEIVKIIEVFCKDHDDPFSKELMRTSEESKPEEKSVYIDYINKIIEDKIEYGDKYTYLREFLYICGFAFKMNSHNMFSELFYKAFETGGLNYRSIDEIIYVFFLDQTGGTLLQAKKTIAEIKKKNNNHNNTLENDYTILLKEKFEDDHSKFTSLEDLKAYLLNGSFSNEKLTVQKQNKTAEAMYYYLANYISYDYTKNRDLDSLPESDKKCLSEVHEKYIERINSKEVINSCKQFGEFVNDHLDCFELDIVNNPQMLDRYFYVVDSFGKLAEDHTQTKMIADNFYELAEPLVGIMDYLKGRDSLFHVLFEECKTLSIFTRRNLIAVYLYYYIYVVSYEVNTEGLFDIFTETLNGILRLCNLPLLSHRYNFDNYVLALSYYIMITEQSK